MCFSKKLFWIAICLPVIASMFVAVPFWAFAHDSENIPTSTEDGDGIHEAILPDGYFNLLLDRMVAGFR